MTHIEKRVFFFFSQRQFRTFCLFQIFFFSDMFPRSGGPLVTEQLLGEGGDNPQYRARTQHYPNPRLLGEKRQNAIS